MSFFNMEIENRIKKNNSLKKINQMIAWEKIAKILEGHREYVGGQRPYDSLKMFKSILLGQWYSLSDLELENSLSLRIDFMMFTGFDMMENIPDETTLCRYRNWLNEKGLDQKLFEEINRQLEEKKLKINKGSIIDATLIESNARAKKQIEEIVKDREEDQTQTEYKETDSKDKDARWLKKGKKSYFGYKGFALVDSEEGFLEQVKVTSANEAEVNKLKDLIENSPSKEIYADKAYDSKNNRDTLKQRQIKDRIMHRAHKNKALSYWEKRHNKMISKIRFRVEQCFGTLKRKFEFYRASYMGREKVEMQMRLKAMCYNLLKASNKLEFTG